MDMTIPNFDGLISKLNDIQKTHLPNVIASTLTDVGNLACVEFQKDITNSIDSPTAFSNVAAFATKVKPGESRVTVGVKDAQAKFLSPLFDGGGRNYKPIESSFVNSEGQTKYIVPGPAAKLDQHGNIPRAAQKMILANAKAKQGGYYSTKNTVRRYDKGLKKSEVVMFLTDKKPQYKKSLDITVIPRIFNEYFERVFRQRMDAIAKK